MDYGRWLGAEADEIYGWVETMLGGEWRDAGLSRLAAETPPRLLQVGVERSRGIE